MRVAALGDLLIEARAGFACGENPSDGVLQFRMNNVTREGGIDFTKTRRVPAATRKLDDYLLVEGDVLFNATNSPELVGKTAYVHSLPERAVFSNHFLRLRPDRTRADGRYLSLWLQKLFHERAFEGICRQWVGQATVNRDRLLAQQIPLPSLPEQLRIAEVLDRTETLRAQRRQALAQLDALAESIFLDMFGDPTTNPQRFPTSQLASLIRQGDTINYGVVQPGDDLDEGVPLVRVGDLRDGRVSHEFLKRIHPSIEATYKRSRLRGDEVLVSCVGTVGRIATADESVKGFNIARAVARIPVAESTERSFVVAYLNTEFVRRYFVNELRTVSQPTLNIKQLSETSIFLPPAELQKAFGVRIAEVDKLKSAQGESLKGLDALFASLQHRAFRGEL